MEGGQKGYCAPMLPGAGAVMLPAGMVMPDAPSAGAFIGPGVFMAGADPVAGIAGAAMAGVAAPASGSPGPFEGAAAGVLVDDAAVEACRPSLFSVSASTLPTCAGRWRPDTFGSRSWCCRSWCRRPGLYSNRRR